MKYSDISPDFVSHTITDKDSIRNSIKNLILIRKFSLGGNPKIGSKLSEFLFKNMSFADEINLQLEIKLALKNYEPRINVLDVSLNLTDYNELFCNIFYNIKDSFDDNTESVSILLNQGNLI